MKQPVGVILAGGQGRRMGGADKALCDLVGQPLLAHVIDRFAPQVEAVAINANGDKGRFSQFGLPVLVDPIPDHVGPLAGVLAGMEWARSQGADHVVTVAVDTPFFPTDLVQRLAQAVKDGAKVVIARSAGRRHPVFALWDVSLADGLRSDIQEGTRRIGQWAMDQSAAAVDFPARETDPFFNINTVEDLEKAQMLSRM